MPISIPTKSLRRAPRKAHNGFTLVEVMVVIFLIGLASAAVILTLPDGRSKTRSEAARLAARIAAARDSAILETRPIAVWISPSGYGFESYRGGQWTPVDKKPFTTQNWPDTIKPVASQAARISFDATGLPSAPLRLPLRNRDGATYIVVISASGEVQIES